MSEENLSRLARDQKQKKHHYFRNTILIILLILLLIGGFGFYNLKHTTDKMYSKSGANATRDANKILLEHKPVSILLLGTDTGALGRHDKGRTDTMMIMTLNPETHKTTLISIPRDMEVNFPNFPQYSPAKINSAYTYGGVREAINTVESHFNIPIDFYVLINMGGLEKAINDVGGVTVKSPLTFSYNGSSFTAGQAEHMNGQTALNFTRMRHQDPLGDYGRQERQRLILAALLHKSISPATLINKSFLDSISDQVRTDLTLNDMRILALSYQGATKKVESTFVQGESQVIDGLDFQVVPEQEQQNISHLILKSLGL